MAEEVTDDKEVDFAMKYVEERNKRIKLEKRLGGILYDIVPFMAVTGELIDAMLIADVSACQKYMLTLIEWHADLEYNITFNMLDPVSPPHFFSDKEIREVDSVSELSETGFDNLKNHWEVLARANLKDWDIWRKPHRFCNLQDMRDQSKARFAKAIEAAKKTQRMNKLKAH